MPPARLARLALAAQNLLRVDLGWLSPKAAQWLHDAAGATPPRYHVVNAAPVTQILETRVGKIGVVLFPEGTEKGQKPSPKQIAAVLAAGKTLKEQARLVIGISPWGYVGERDFLPQAGGIFGCLMGGGEGVGFAFSLNENPAVLWLRPDSQGRAVNIVELLELPALGKTPRWRENDSFRASLEFLDDSFPSDPAMQQLLNTEAPKK